MSDKLIKVLLIEENDADIHLINNMLNETKNTCFQIMNCKTLNDGIIQLNNNDFNVILLDLCLPDIPGIDPFIKLYEQEKKIPIIILTGLEDEENGIKAIQNGAQDYLVKGQSNDFIARSIQYSIERKNTEEKLKNYQLHLEEIVKNRTIQLENVIKKLELEIIDHKKSEDQLKSAVQEKEVLLQEVHHRVKNNMQIISSLLSLQAMHVNDEEMIDLLRDSQNRIRSMAMVHEKLYMSNDLSNINMAEYIKKLVLTIFDSYSTKKSQIMPLLELDDILMNIETGIPCGIIINELVSNSLKYAFPEDNEGSIFVGLKDKGDQYELTVSDDGVGIPKNINLDETPETLGLMLVNSLINQLNGSLELNQDYKTEFIINFK
jgi:two-component sensor histidine kinase/CheY-like chemotaxis protein